MFWMFQENRTEPVGGNTGKQILISYGDKNGSCAVMRKAVATGQLRASCHIHRILVFRRKPHKVLFDAPFTNNEAF